MFRTNFGSMKIFIFLLCLTLAFSDETLKTSTTIAPVEESDTAKCNESNTACCSQLYIGVEKDLAKCLSIHQRKLPQEGDKDLAKLYKFLSYFVECQYKQRKYLGKGDNINIKMVKNDAAKLFPGRPKERDFHVEMFDFCRKDGNYVYNVMKMNPGGKVLIKDTYKPYFMFVYLCNAEYHKKHRCPYFRWRGETKTDNEQVCAQAKKTCYKVDGIST